jgi:DNA topoisomerase VI subunit A
MDPTAITNIVHSVTKKWAKQRKAEEREANARARRHQVLAHSQHETIKEVAWEVMEAAYLKASSDGALPAHARQIMYAARGVIQERTKRPLDDQYFTQTLLPDYMIANREKTRNWNVVFDARGHLTEPHTGRTVPLGTLEVTRYLSAAAGHSVEALGVPFSRNALYPTCGSSMRFSAILFIEKEGFMPLFKEVKLAERFDIAIMSTKGMSVTASRLLVDTLCSEEGVPLLVLHDFDQAGFSILGTLQRDTRRYEFQNQVNVIDLGLRLDDVKKYELSAEEVYYRSNPASNLEENGATEEEIQFLCDDGHGGQRVELNAFTSADLVEWIESKLRLHRIKKLIPDNKALEQAYRRNLEIDLVNEELEEIQEDIGRRVSAAKVPRDLARRVMARLKTNPEMPWDRAVALEVERHG